MDGSSSGREITLPDGFFDRLDLSQFSVPQLMALAVLEAGRPLSEEEIAARLAARGLVRTLAQLRKAWHGIPPLIRARDGRLTLEEDRPDDPFGPLRRLITHTRWTLERASRPAAPAAPDGTTPGAAGPDSRTPISLEELEAMAATGGVPYGVLSNRLAIALLLEAEGAPLPVERAAAELTRLIGYKVAAQDVLNSARGLPGALRLLDDGTVALVADHPSLARARGALRRFLDRAREAERARERSARWREQHERERDQERAAARRWYEAARIAVVRWVEAGDRIAAASLLDPSSRTFVDCTGSPDEVVAALREALARVDLVLALQPRRLFEWLDEPPGSRRLLDLSPPQKSITINRSRRQVKITPQMIVRSTLGGSFRVATERELRDGLTRGRKGQLPRRLHGDLKALWRLYEYGALHGFVRLRWGFLDEGLGVAWNVGGQARLYDQLLAAGEQRQWLQLVTRSAPSWDDPWSRAWPACVVALGPHQAVVEDRDGVESQVLLAEIFAVRVTGPPGPSRTGPPDLPDNVVSFQRRGAGSV